MRPWQVTASRYRFDPPRIEVFQDDLVKIELRTRDIAHSLTIDAYRIAKRVSAGQPVTFEFRADQAGTFPFYCNLQIDDGCRQMRGELRGQAQEMSRRNQTASSSGCRLRAEGRGPRMP